MDFASLEPTLAAAQDYVAARAPRGYYAETYRGYEASYLPWLAEELGRRHPGRAVDVGPGWGTMAVYLRAGGWEVDVLDFLPVGHFITSELLAETGIGYHQGLVEHGEVPVALKGKADLVLMSMVLGHLRYRPDVGVAHAATMLKPAGCFLCCNLDAAKHTHVDCAYADWRQMPVPGDGQPVSAAMVTNMMTVADYEEVLGRCFHEVDVVRVEQHPILYGICNAPR